MIGIGNAVTPVLRYAFTTMIRRSIVFSVALALAGCNTGPAPAASSADPAPSTVVPAAVASAPAGPVPPPVHLGEPLSAPEVALADVAKDPGRFSGQAFTTRGTVTSVCQEMGCWMEIKDASTGAHLRMHGHAFFVPKSAGGRQARVQATLVPSNAPKACADDECASKNVALLQLDASGVELD